MSSEPNNIRPTIRKSSIVIIRPTIRKSLPPVSFIINPSLIPLIKRSCQFGGLPSEDPYMHIYNFILISDTFNKDDISEDDIRLRLFPFSLRDSASWWLRSLPAASITTWDEVVAKFFAKYSPLSKLVKLKNDIVTFSRLESESLYEAKKRFEDLLRRCPGHGISDWHRIFFEGLVSANHQSSLDVAIGGFLREYKPTEAYDLIDEMASVNYPFQFDTHVMNNLLGFPLSITSVNLTHM